METLAYTYLHIAHQEASFDLDAYELKLFEGLNWKRLPSSAWLSLLGVAVLLSGLSVTVPANALRVNTPSGRCLNARYGPSTQYGVYTCVRNGATLKPAVGNQGDWIQLSSGRWVYGPYTSGSRGTAGGNVGSVGTAVVRTSGSSLYVRATPGGAIVGSLANGSSISLSGRTSGNWSQLSNGNWVASRWISRGGVVYPGSNNPSSDTLRLGSSGQEVINVQNRLRTLGFYRGPVNGYYGDLTEASVRDFQASRGLRANGLADSRTLRALYY